MGVFQSKKKNLEKELCLVTGGASGIGSGLVIRLLSENATVVVWDVSAGFLKKLEKTVSDLGLRDKLHLYAVDVSNREIVSAAAERVKKEVGSITLLVNNAGIVNGQNFLDINDQSLERVVGVNSLALFWTTKAFLPDMLKNKHGHIVTMSSAAAFVQTPRLVDYSASKAFAQSFHENLRYELARNYGDEGRAIKTTVVCPYFINTGMFHGATTRFSFLLPILNENDVCNAVFSAIEKEKLFVMMPWFMYAVPFLKSFLPSTVFEWISDLFGVHKCMTKFTGKYSKNE